MCFSDICQTHSLNCLANICYHFVWKMCPTKHHIEPWQSPFFRSDAPPSSSSSYIILSLEVWSPAVVSAFTADLGKHLNNKTQPTNSQSHFGWCTRCVPKWCTICNLYMNTMVWSHGPWNGFTCTVVLYRRKYSSILSFVLNKQRFLNDVLTCNECPWRMPFVRVLCVLQLSWICDDNVRLLDMYIGILLLMI